VVPPTSAGTTSTRREGIRRPILVGNTDRTTVASACHAKRSNFAAPVNRPYGMAGTAIRRASPPLVGHSKRGDLKIGERLGRSAAPSWCTGRPESA
jgi:hypothetical protein